MQKLSLKRQKNSASYILSLQTFHNFQKVMKPSSKRKIKKKITKHIIHLIIFKEEHLSSPHNTNQYLLTKHMNQEICQDIEPKEPGSMLSFLLNEQRPQSRDPLFQLQDQERLVKDCTDMLKNQP
ncbi:unnamed protein product [Paramecium primaurelia]|uniref:Uncharacterized protein n=1 Tax=Paramecium primaurelia TaxID=5886 RepID=A0A8S1K8D3_PARPR|nr:unnamed protein product [Paramecium primaurelia]